MNLSILIRMGKFTSKVIELAPGLVLVVLLLVKIFSSLKNDLPYQFFRQLMQFFQNFFTSSLNLQQNKLRGLSLESLSRLVCCVVLDNQYQTKFAIWKMHIWLALRWRYLTEDKSQLVLLTRLFEVSNETSQLPSFSSQSSQRCPVIFQKIQGDTKVVWAYQYHPIMMTDCN